MEPGELRDSELYSELRDAGFREKMQKKEVRGHRSSTEYLAEFLQRWTLKPVDSNMSSSRKLLVCFGRALLRARAGVEDSAHGPEPGAFS